MPLLHCDRVSKLFGGVHAVEEVDLSVQVGEQVGLIGPNGSGKSTLLNVISGFYKPDGGKVLFASQNINGMSPHKLHRLGIGRTFQNLRLFDELTVEENILIGLHTVFEGDGNAVSGWLGPLVGTRKARARRQRARTLAAEAVRANELGTYRFRKARELPYGVRKRLELARVFALPPHLILLDEPTAGLSHEEAEIIGNVIRSHVAERGLAVLLVEHRLDWVLANSDRVAVLDSGRMIALGPPDEVAKNAAVIEAYSGTE